MSSFFPAAPAKTGDEKAAERAEAEERTEERKNQANLARERTAVVLAMLQIAVVNHTVTDVRLTRPGSG